jgi:hypothetical protein
MIFKLKDISLSTGHWESAYLEHAGWSKYYFPDMISIYVAVSDNDENIDWELDDLYDNDSIGYNGDIKNFSSIRESFDEKKGYFTYDDIELEVYNTTEFWSDNIFNDTTKRIEIRIISFKQRGNYGGNLGWYIESKYDYEPVFAGVVLLDDYELTFREGLNVRQDAKYWSYKFRAFSMLKILESKTIDDLKLELEKDFPPVYSTMKYTNPIKTTIHSQYNRNTLAPYSLQENYELNDTIEWEFIPISSIIKSIFSLTGLPLPYFSVQSEFYFFQKNIYNAPYQSINNLYIPFRKWENGKEPRGSLNHKGGFYHRKFFDNNIFDTDEDKDKYKPPVDDNDVKARQWSFYNFNNCIELLCNISHSFGMVWYIKYNKKNQIYESIYKPYIFEATIDCNPRRLSLTNTNATPVVIGKNKLKEATVKVSSAELINGYKVISAGLDDYMIGTKDDITLNLLFALWNPNWWGGNYDKCNAGKGSGLIWEHCLYYFDGLDYNSGLMRLVDSVGIANFETYQPPINNDRNSCLMEAIAKYYADKNIGVWSEVYLTYNLTFLTAKGFKANANFEIDTNTIDTYQAIKPCHIIKINNYSQDTLIITKVEKDIFNNNTKIEAIKY